MKKSITCVLIATMVFLTACNGSTGSDSGASSAKESVVSEVTETVEQTGETENTDSSQDSSVVPYSEQNGLEFGSLSPFSADYSLMFVDNTTYEVIDNDDFHVIDKGDADYIFYDVETWPAEKEGYTTLKLTYSVDCANKTHAPTDFGNISSWINVAEIAAFDYYTGVYIPSYENEKALDNTDTAVSGAVETKVGFGDHEWDITAWQEDSDVRYYNGYEFTDDSHTDSTETYSKTQSIYVTYPNDYDGLSFAVQNKGEYHVSTEDIKNAADEGKNKNIGKDILSVFNEDDISVDNVLFLTIKNEDSMKIAKVNSEDDATIPDYAERTGLTAYSDSSLAKGFSLPYVFYVSDENGTLINEDKVQPEKGNVDYEITDVSTETQGNDTKVSLSYRVSKKISVDVTNYDGDFNGWAVNPDIEAYYSTTGESIEIKGDYSEDNSDWGEWEDDTHTSYNIDYTYKAEFTIPTEKFDDAVVNYGDRKSSDSIRFKLSDILSD